MDRRYIFGFLFGVLATVMILWVGSAWDSYQKQEASKNTTEQQVAVLIEERMMRRADIEQMRIEISNLRNQLNANSIDKMRMDLDDMKFKQNEFERIFFDFKNSLGR